MKVIYFDHELDIKMVFPSGVALAKWLQVPVYKVFSVLDYGWKEEGWDAKRLKSPE